MSITKTRARFGYNYDKGKVWVNYDEGKVCQCLEVPAQSVVKEFLFFADWYQTLQTIKIYHGKDQNISK